MTQARANRRWWTQLLAGAMAAALALLLIPASPAAAAVPGTITAADFRTADQVRTDMAGRGTWERYLTRTGEGRSIGARPARCRSDLPFAAAQRFRIGSYYGRPPAGVGAQYATVSVVVHRFASVTSASAAVRAASAQTIACPEVVEWVCTQCDGVWTSRNRVTRIDRVGQQSVSWRAKVSGNAHEHDRIVVARWGRTVVRVQLGHGTMNLPSSDYYPVIPSEARAVTVARRALLAATT